jgi:hypothetical protein
MRGVEWALDGFDDDNYGSGTNTEVGAVYRISPYFAEQIHDFRRTAFEKKVAHAPDEAVAQFLRDVAIVEHIEARRIQALGLSQEEVLDLASEMYDRALDEIPDFIRGTLCEYLDLLDPSKQSKDLPPVVLTIGQTLLREWGIVRGPLYEEAPWTLYALRPHELRQEGLVMRHCVGKQGMGYVQAVTEGEIAIWSLRDRKAKPRFTLEVDLTLMDDLGDHEGTPQVSDPSAFLQIKGKANRLPGFAGMSRDAEGNFSFPEEVTFWRNVLSRLGVTDDEALLSIRDLRPGLSALLARANRRRRRNTVRAGHR